jgi:hypothetical protein
MMQARGRAVVAAAHRPRVRQTRPCRSRQAACVPSGVLGEPFDDTIEALVPNELLHLHMSEHSELDFIKTLAVAESYAKF